MRKEVKEELEVRACWQQIEDFFDDPTKKIFCPHLRIGSSQFLRLISGTLTPEKVHKRSYYYGARSDGEKFERIFQMFDTLEDIDNNKYVFVEKNSQPFKISNDFPFVCATPDFRVVLSKNGGENQTYLVEVKHSKQKSTVDKIINGEKNDESMQLKCALNIFGIEKGLLVCYYDKNTEDQDDWVAYAKEMTADSLFEEKKEDILKGYAKYLIKLIREQTQNDLALTLEDEILKKIKTRFSTPSQGKMLLEEGIPRPKAFCPLNLRYLPPGKQKKPKVGRKKKTQQVGETHRCATRKIK